MEGRNMNEEFVTSLTQAQKMELRAFFMERQREEHRKKVEHYRHLNRFALPHQILLVGSSLMEQFPVHELLIHQQLSCTVYNRGIGGITTHDLLEYMDVCIYDLQPDYIYINIGTNDMNRPYYTEEGLIDRYRTILQMIREHLPWTKVFLLAYYPVNPEAAPAMMKEAFQMRTNDRINSANRAIAKLAEEVGATYLDVGAGIRDGQGALKEDYAVDGIHMYADGYAQVLEAVLPYLPKERMPVMDPGSTGIKKQQTTGHRSLEK